MNEKIKTKSNKDCIFAKKRNESEIKMTDEELFDKFESVYLN